MRVHLLLLLSLGMTCLGHDEVTPKPKLLQKGSAIDGLSGHARDAIVFKFIVPPQAANLVFKSSGGSGDIDLFARHNAYPTKDNFDGASRLSGTKEDIRLPQAEDGIWYVLVDAYTDFSDVRLSATYTLRRGALDTPRSVPGPGVFAGNARIELKGAPGGPVIRFSTDGSEPTESSQVYSAPLTITKSTRLRAKAFNRKGKASPEFDAVYDVRPGGEVTLLGNGVAAHHLAGTVSSEHLFKIGVSGGESNLLVTTEGGAGKTELLVKLGSPPTATDFTQKGHGKGNRTSLQIDKPAAGEWFIAVRGRSNFSGVSTLAFARPDGVDLIAWQPALEPYISVETFSRNDCEVQEGMTIPGTHTLLRFNTETRNVGSTDLVMPSPEGNTAFEFAECHGHYHFKGFASYRLLDSAGLEVALGKKVSFCLLDLSRWDSAANEQSRFDCMQQGIQAGWADVYDGGLPGQWIDISDVAPGTYTLEITINPDHVLEEADYDNNTATIQVVVE